MNAIKTKLSEVKLNPNNPRLIKDDNFKKLVQSIKDFPEMLDIRPIVVNADMVILGGNMRFKACKEAGLKEVPIIVADNLTEEQQREFLIKDNVSGGEWDWSLLNDWDSEQLEEWGLIVSNFNSDNIDLNSFFEENNEQKEQKNKITLEYTQEEFELVTEAFTKHTGSKEQIVFKLLGL
jgi:ParB-like chromosome segregation protein Spo0J